MVESIPEVTLVFREDGEFVYRSSKELFEGKRVILFGLPGAFTPTCSAYQLPGYEQEFDKFKTYGVEEIYCTSVNDAFVMNAWAKEQDIKNVKLIPDGNGDFADGMGMLVQKENLGFSFRSWRYSALVDNGVITKLFVEDGLQDNAPSDPYAVSDPYTMLSHLAHTTGIPIPN